jgi:hypothetical protein
MRDSDVYYEHDLTHTAGVRGFFFGAECADLASLWPRMSVWVDVCSTLLSGKLLHRADVFFGT